MRAVRQSLSDRGREHCRRAGLLWPLEVYGLQRLRARLPERGADGVRRNAERGSNGLFQVLSIIPGTSRSGATIIGALLIGVSRVAAAEFTFFLAVPVMIGLSFIKILKFGFAFTGGELIVLLLGSAVAFVVSLLVVRFLMNYIRKHDFTAFGWYRIALGIVVILALVVLK